MSHAVPEPFLKRAKEFLGEPPKFVSSAPGRADLLNTHQDYKRLPAVPMAIDLRLYMLATHIAEPKLQIRSDELASSAGSGDFEVDLSHPSNTDRDPSGYLASVIRTVRKFAKVENLGGMRIFVRSQIPVGSGMGSSGALEVAFLSLLNGCCSLGLTLRDIAEYAFLSENVEMGIPCGRLDQYSSAYGGMIVIRQRPTVSVEYLDTPPLDLVIIDSGEEHRTESIHPVRQGEIDRGLSTLISSSAVSKHLKSRLGGNCQEADWQSIHREEITRYLFLLPRSSADRIMFTLQMNGSTLLALDIITKRKVSMSSARSSLGEERAARLAQSGWPFLESLGEVMNVQHELLRDLYEVSTPRLEVIRDAALYLGRALGVKISGAGMGGSLAALVKSREDGERVVKESKDAGAANAWLVRKGSGCWYQGGH